MALDIINKVVYPVLGYLINNYTSNELEVIVNELKDIINFDIITYNSDNNLNYEQLQYYLSNVNEKQSKRKTNGVYYTANDVVRFIFFNTIKSLYCNVKTTNLHVMDLNGIPYKKFCYNDTVFDPTCGAGEFLLVALSVKFDLVDLHQDNVSNIDIINILKTINGNDIDNESTTISKLRLFLYILHRYGVSRIVGTGNILNLDFYNYDFINLDKTFNKYYDMIIGNPPYVEDSKCDTKPIKKYGNVYANVLENVSNCLTDGGSIGFIVPLSYVSTPRMSRIRHLMSEKLSEQVILSYCDRPDCLFPKVHQKLCILIGKNNPTMGYSKFITGNYQFWYKEEREELFVQIPSIENNFIKQEFIPKLGTINDINIYNKIINNDISLMDVMSKGDYSLFVNMRAAFWIKAFRNEHVSKEYKMFFCETDEIANFCLCILNSSLFWWFWICVSDCWHITNKELNEFKILLNFDSKIINNLSKMLECKLENTKIYVGTKQTDYEYKHKDCLEVIHKIDNYINSLFGLSEEESLYIKNFAIKYRVSGGRKR